MLISHNGIAPNSFGNLFGVRVGGYMRRVFVALVLALSIAGIVYPATLRAAEVAGTLSIDGKKKLKDLIVYLQGTAKGAAKTSPESKVSQKSQTFKPELTVIVQGSTVVFVNDESQDIDHNVYSLSKTKKFDLGLLSRNAETPITFEKPGVVKYYCSIHKNMEGTVVVVPSSYYALLAKPGAFAIKSVPSGKWTAKAVLSHKRYKAQPIDITVGADPVMDVVISVKRKGRKRKKKRK